MHQTTRVIKLKQSIEIELNLFLIQRKQKFIMVLLN